jgi:Zn/Cd-binding protein ZinT
MAQSTSPHATGLARETTIMLVIAYKCGNRGVTLMFTKREQRAKMKLVAWDRWNLAG